jgi:hypothetical protein
MFVKLHGLWVSLLMLCVYPGGGVCLGRLMPVDQVGLLRSDPTLASQVCRLDHLSLW